MWRRDGQIIRLVRPRFERCRATGSQEFGPCGLKQASDYVGEGRAACDVECSIPLAVMGERLGDKSRIVRDLAGLEGASIAQEKLAKERVYVVVASLFR